MITCHTKFWIMNQKHLSMMPTNNSHLWSLHCWMTTMLWSNQQSRRFLQFLNYKNSSINPLKPTKSNRGRKCKYIGLPEEVIKKKKAEDNATAAKNYRESQKREKDQLRMENEVLNHENSNLKLENETLKVWQSSLK